jgi:hypothetical protein
MTDFDEWIPGAYTICSFYFRANPRPLVSASSSGRGIHALSTPRTSCYRKCRAHCARMRGCNGTPVLRVFVRSTSPEYRGHALEPLQAVVSVAANDESSCGFSAAPYISIRYVNFFPSTSPVVEVSNGSHVATAPSGHLTSRAFMIT